MTKNELASLLMADRTLVSPLRGDEHESLEKLTAYWKRGWDTRSDFVNAFYEDPEIHVVDQLYFNTLYLCSIHPYYEPGRPVRCVRTASRRLGVVPPASEVDDVLVVFPGAPRPSVLRPCKDVYQLVGQAYIHGIMSGEFFDDPEFGLQELLIC
jgi:hypothetical protein